MTTALRVITVGPTGTEASLRRERGVELIRARTPMDALSELADPVDDQSPSATIVLMSEASDRAHAAGERAGFLGALRQVDPAVRLVLASDQPMRTPPAHYDAVVPRDVSAETLRLASSRPQASPQAHAMPPAVVAGEAGPRVPRIEPGTHLADETLAAALALGRDVLPEALVLIRERTGDPSVQFCPPGQVEGPGVPVASGGGQVLGALTGRDHVALSKHAAWLGHWLRASSLQRELQQAAFRDHLTGAWNRRYFDRYLPACLDRARGKRLPVTLMLFDVDNFKQFNDHHGHAAGDEILIETVRLIDSVVRPHDRVCRIGGDEFAVVFYEPSGPRDPGSQPPADVFALAERFQHRVIGHHFPKLGRDAPGTLTISGGLATFPWDATTAEDLIEHADQLAMQSKQLGKNMLTLGPGAMRYRARGCKDDTNHG